MMNGKRIRREHARTAVAVRRTGDRSQLREQRLHEATGS